MKGRWPVLLVLCAFALSGCAGMIGTKGQEPAGLTGGKPLTDVERQQLDCQTRLGKVEGTCVEPRKDCILVTFRCDTLFERNTCRINSSTCGLDDLADILKNYSGTKIRVDAHTDCTRSEEENLILSETQAGAVKEALVERGVNSSRIMARGWGESKPAASNATEAGRQTNRRVTVTLFPSQS